MIKAALLGRDIAYTLSPEIHAAIAAAVGEELSFDVVDVPYDALDVEVGKLLTEYDGFFITKPYKNDVKRFLKNYPANCGVNFVSCADGRGYNTDGIGFMRALEASFGSTDGKIKSALVLGAGGAAHSVSEALIQAGINVYVLNRTGITAAKMCAALGPNAQMYFNQPAELIVNCTSVGLHNDDVLTALCVLPDFKYAFDLIYNPPVTPFLRRCDAAGARTANGLDMLIYQAIEGDKILFGRDINVPQVYEAVRKALKG